MKEKCEMSSFFRFFNQLFVVGDLPIFPRKVFNRLRDPAEIELLGLFFNYNFNQPNRLFRLDRVHSNNSSFLNIHVLG
jgi:hypothetical protein